jgi:uncharacterized C2H2 Zn-finger protein
MINFAFSYKLHNLQFCQGEFIRRAEIIFSANYISIDEDSGNKDGETIMDRISVIPFEEWEDCSAQEFATKQIAFKKVVDSPEKPTELVIGEMGDFIGSAEFINKRSEFANFVYEKTDECVKLRTLLTNYGGFYAILWKLHQVFEPVWAEQGKTWEGFLDWSEQVHAPFLKKQHREKDHSKHSIRRYVTDLLGYLIDWTVLERRKILKICETSKLKNGQKYCLAFHASPRYMDFQEMGGVKLKDLKAHTNAIGGAWGDDTWAALVKDGCEAVFETPEEETAGLEETQAKRALLIPINVFTSSHIMRIATMTGQTEDFKKFGVDEETPSGIEDPKNSTQRSGTGASSLDLHLSDVSIIRARGEDDNHGIVFDELQEDNFLEETNYESNMELTNVEEDVDGQDDDIEFSAASERSVANSSAAASKIEITVMESADKTFFVCNCGYSSTSRSGVSRHKCKKAVDVSFPCKECGQICRNPGSLKRHMNSKHVKTISLLTAPLSIRCSECGLEVDSKDALIKHQQSNHRQSTSLPTYDANAKFSCHICSNSYQTNKNLENHIQKKHGATSGSAESSTYNDPSLPADDKEFSCNICGKKLKSKINLENHVSKVHEKTDAGPSSSFATTVLEKDVSMEHISTKCTECGKILANVKNLKIHMKKVHRVQVILKPNCFSLFINFFKDVSLVDSSSGLASSMSSLTECEQTSASATPLPPPVSKVPSSSLATTVLEKDVSMGHISTKCTDCGKILANVRNLKLHMKKVHNIQVILRLDCFSIIHSFSPRMVL